MHVHLVYLAKLKGQINDELVRICDEKFLNEDMKAIDRAINYRHNRRRRRRPRLHIHIRRLYYCRNLHGRVSSDDVVV